MTGMHDDSVFLEKSDRQVFVGAMFVYFQDRVPPAVGVEELCWVFPGYGRLQKRTIVPDPFEQLRPKGVALREKCRKRQLCRRVQGKVRVCNYLEAIKSRPREGLRPGYRHPGDLHLG